MDPVSLATIGIAASAGSGIIESVGKIMGGEAQSTMYRYQAGIADMKRRMALQTASWERAAGETEAQIRGMKARFQGGEIKISQAAAGVDVTRGSAVEAQKREQDIGRFDEAMARNNAARKAYGYEVTAADEAAQGQLDKMAAGYSMESGLIGAGSSLLGAAGSVASKWSQAKESISGWGSGTYWVGGSPAGLY